MDGSLVVGFGSIKNDFDIRSYIMSLIFFVFEGEFEMLGFSEFLILGVGNFRGWIHVMWFGVHESLTFML